LTSKALSLHGTVYGKPAQSEHWHSMVAQSSFDAFRSIGIRDSCNAEAVISRNGLLVCVADGQKSFMDAPEVLLIQLAWQAENPLFEAGLSTRLQ
jgi:hypothetical protein